MLRTPILIGLLAGVVSLVAVACGGDGEPSPTPQRPSPSPPPPAPTTTVATVVPTTETPCPADGTAIGVNLEDLGGSGDYRFAPSNLTFKTGEAGCFTLTAETEFHTFTVDDLGIDVSIDGGATETLVFTFDQPGTYQLICIPHEALGMVGTITVQ